ncbi:hypothetical protein SAMN05444166_4718 [Singulisphaera sp. GP187]|uniref:hypothetical protein n=1 Tax=Singulisphaera sp. GP187 TaxID=1882752 RepID=UPI00092B8E7B|nr:hypothetical protein [Singulisphaera sp. GP187]SIO43740.1 hypothetical protein SAMN05444166_4718 [Singulisphaera sp. GP187]
MGHWGVKSYENDDASDALEAGFDEVHGAVYDDLMDDRSPLTFEQVQAKLADARTLAAALAALSATVGAPFEEWDEVERLAFAGVVVRHAELDVPIPDEARTRALDWLEYEEIEWDETTARRLRREKEVALLRKIKPPVA